MPSILIRNILKATDSVRVPQGLNLGRRATFDRLASLACRATGRSRAAFYLNLRSVEFVIGAHGDIVKEHWERELPPHIHDAEFFDIADAMLALDDLDSVNGNYSTTKGLTLVGVMHEGVKLGNLVVADSEKAGPLSDAEKSSLLKIAKMAGEMIDYYSQVALLAQDARKIVTETSVYSVLPPDGA